MREHRDLIRAWRSLPPGTEAVLATVVAARSSVYRRPGARMLLTRDGWIAGSVSGGCVESDLVQTAFDRTADGPTVVTYDASAPDDVLLGFGLGCNGAVDVLMHRLPDDGGPLRVIEGVLRDRREAILETYADGSWTSTGLPLSSPRRIGTVLRGQTPRDERGWGGEQGRLLLTETILPPPALTIFGAGHDAVPLVRIADEIGWHVTIVDGRAAYARADRFPTAGAVLVSPPSQALPVEGAAVLMTHSFAHDAAILRWLPRDLPYVGVLGPIHRTQRLLEEAGIETEDLYAPVGLDLGAEGPDEIALAIVAEILAVQKGRAGGHLKGRMTPLHEEREAARVGRLG